MLYIAVTKLILNNFLSANNIILKSDLINGIHYHVSMLKHRHGCYTIIKWKCVD